MQPRKKTLADLCTTLRPAGQAGSVQVDFNDAAQRFVEVQNTTPFMEGSRLHDFLQS